MAPRRRRRRPWHPRRAYRLARTALLTVVMVVMGVRCEARHRPVAPEAAGGPGTVAAAGVHPGSARSDGRGADHADAAPAPAAPARTAPASSASPVRPMPRSRPVSFRIPSLGIDAPVIGVKLEKDRQLETPPLGKPKLVGWYQGGPTPGESGTAVAVGHRDTMTGPAVFAGLAQVKPGKPIEVRRADGRTAVYTVDRVKVYDKAGFPDKEVYGASKRPELRVLTCGGLYSRRTGYTSNVVVFAHLTATK
ncbi:class F sortase [Streptomyces sp. L2]|uniref:class F sortase n=1 Tax=Streptomyces sp. L2 TaxID=2162665 RepID=UPI0010105D75|nr:class F sortase [Streptomyces sp. L2]